MSCWVLGRNNELFLLLLYLTIDPATSLKYDTLAYNHEFIWLIYCYFTWQDPVIAVPMLADVSYKYPKMVVWLVGKDLFVIGKMESKSFRLFFDDLKLGK